MRFAAARPLQHGCRHLPDGHGSPLAFAGPQPAQPEVADPTTVTIDEKSIGGLVTSRFGPEAGVWVIAETKDLGTRFAKIVVTDERDRYVIPDLPKANYRVWVRGYGLVDSEKVPSELGKTLNLTAVVAPSPAAAAQYYPAIYRASMIRVPDKSRFPGTGDKGNGIPENFKTETGGSTSSRPTAAAIATRSATTRRGLSPKRLVTLTRRATLGHTGSRSGRPGTTC